MNTWQPIETAPKDGTEILGWGEYTGIMLMRWIAPCDFLHESELSKMNDSESPDWFYADFVTGGRLDDPMTHWMPCPLPPASN